MIELQLLLATFAAWSNRRQAGVIAYLVEENRVLKEQIESEGRRLRFTDGQRRRLAARGKPLGLKALQQIATIVTPETILAWHRRLIVPGLPKLREDATCSGNRPQLRIGERVTPTLAGLAGTWSFSRHSSPRHPQ